VNNNEENHLEDGTEISPKKSGQKRSSLPTPIKNIKMENYPRNKLKTTKTLSQTTLDIENKEKINGKLNTSHHNNQEKSYLSNRIDINKNVSYNISPTKEQNNKVNSSFSLNLQNLPKNNDYNQEFMSKYEEFSPSWRNECKKLKGLNNEMEELKLERVADK